jgi:hypothetical protein
VINGKSVSAKVQNGKIKYLSLLAQNKIFCSTCSNIAVFGERNKKKYKFAVINVCNSSNSPLHLIKRHTKITNVDLAFPFDCKITHTL